MPNFNDDPNMVPTMRMSPLYRDYMPPVKRYTSSALPQLKDIPTGDEGKGLRAMAQSDKGKEQVKEFGYDPNSALARHMKFCGGMSKPYGKK